MLSRLQINLLNAFRHQLLFLLAKKDSTAETSGFNQNMTDFSSAMTEKLLKLPQFNLMNLHAQQARFAFEKEHCFRYRKSPDPGRMKHPPFLLGCKDPCSLEGY